MSTNGDAVGKYLMKRSKPHESWGESLVSSWISREPEVFDNMIGPTIGITQDIADATGGVIQQVEANIYSLLENRSITRTQSIGFQCMIERLEMREADWPYIDVCLQRLWDGMRQLPYSNLELSSALAQCLWLAIYGVGWWRDYQGQRADAIISDKTREASIFLEICGSEGAYAKCFAPVSTVHVALRPDLHDILTQSGRALMPELSHFFQVVHDPRMVFDFKSLTSLFATHWIPSQVLLAGEKSPVFFSPMQIDRLGVP
jgi:hypothetical protein